MSQKTYVPKSSAKLRTGIQWFELKLGFHASSLIEFIKANTNDRGYINLGVTERKSPGERGDTHSVWLDTWQPKSTQPKSEPAYTTEPDITGLTNNDTTVPF